MMTKEQIVDMIKKQDKHACNVCQKVAEALEDRQRLWYVSSSPYGNVPAFSAIVRAKNITEAFAAVPFSSTAHALEIDIDAVNVPFERTGYPNMIMSKVL